MLLIHVNVVILSLWHLLNYADDWCSSPSTCQCAKSGCWCHFWPGTGSPSGVEWRHHWTDWLPVCRKVLPDCRSSYWPTLIMAFCRCNRSSTSCYGASTAPKFVQALTAPLAMQISPQGVGGQVRKSLSRMAGVSMFERWFCHTPLPYLSIFTLSFAGSACCPDMHFQVAAVYAKLRMQWQ